MQLTIRLAPEAKRRLELVAHCLDQTQAELVNYGVELVAKRRLKKENLQAIETLARRPERRRSPRG